MGSFSDGFLNDFTAISAAQNAYTQAVVFEVAKVSRIEPFMGGYYALGFRAKP